MAVCFLRRVMTRTFGTTQPWLKLMIKQWHRLRWLYRVHVPDTWCFTFTWELCVFISSGFLKCFLVVVVFLLQNALKGEDTMASHTKEKPGNKRKNNKKSKSRKKSNTVPEGEVNPRYLYSYTRSCFNLPQIRFFFMIRYRLIDLTAAPSKDTNKKW